MKLKQEWSMKTLLSDRKNPDINIRQLSSRHSETDFAFSYPGLGNGRIHSFITPGLELSKLDIQLEKDLVIYADDNIERYVSSFVTRGSIDSNFGHAGSSATQARMSHIFTHIEAKSCVHRIHAGKTSVTYLNLKPDFLFNLLPEWDAVSDRIPWQNKGSRFHLSHARDIRHNMRIQQLLSDFSEEKFDGGTRSLLYEVKAMEILATQLDELDSGMAQPEYTISKADKEKLVALYDFITVNFLEPLPLGEMARQFLLNEFKIKKGFKQLYGESAFSYMQRLRLEHAHVLMQAGAINVSDASDLTGYSSIHNFSNAFLKKFGYRPGTIARTVALGNAV